MEYKPRSSSCLSCRGGDNQASGCPTRMADGRLFTDYRPRCDIAMQFAAPMTSSFEYRKWMIENGQRILDHQRHTAFAIAKCAPCSVPATMPLEKDRFVCNKVSCVRVATPFNSIEEKVRAFGSGNGVGWATAHMGGGGRA